MLRLFTGVVLELVSVVVFTGVDVLATEMFSDAESVPWSPGRIERFLLKGAISLGISFWFSAKLFVKSDKTSFSKIFLFHLSFQVRL